MSILTGSVTKLGAQVLFIATPRHVLLLHRCIYICHLFFFACLQENLAQVFAHTRLVCSMKGSVRAVCSVRCKFLRYGCIEQIDDVYARRWDCFMHERFRRFERYIPAFPFIHLFILTAFTHAIRSCFWNQSRHVTNLY